MLIAWSLLIVSFGGMTLLRQFILYIILIYFSSLLLIHFSILLFKLVCNIDFLFQSITKKRRKYN